ncbi:MAG: type VI secretion system Vgr family protein [Pseudomonadota bacterium]
MNNVIRSLYDLIQGRQHNRILRIAFPHNDAPASSFLVNRLDATESLSRDFAFTVELLSDDANVPLKEMQGKLLSIELVRGDGTLRYFTGYVFSFQRKKSDGSITFYEARLGPWLQYLSLRKDNYLFHEKSLREQTDSIFADYATYPDWDWRVAGEDAPMTDACQFDETDFNYLSRRWEAAGYYYWYEHSAEGHKLVVADDSTMAAPIDGGGGVRFQRHGGIKEEDGIDNWSPVRHLAPSSVALSSFNFKSPAPADVVVPTLAKQGNVPAIETYEYAGAYGFDNLKDGDALGQLRMEEVEGQSKYYEAQGNNRFVLPGRSLQLLDHFEFHRLGERQAGGNDFLVLAVEHTASNNYLTQSDAGPYYRNRMTCTRKNVTWRPGRDFNSKTTRILAPQTAIVVGPSGPDSIHTDQYGRIRVQFHWDRVGSRDERSSAWVRVASLWAGAELGASAIPRVGSEVIVQWLDGNPDRPIVIGSVRNELTMPPWKLTDQQALMGLRSRELAPRRGNTAGGRSNHLILDDTNAHIQAQLKSDHQCSQLSLGHITRIEDTTGRKDARGEGWEIATNAWGVARAAKGMLLTTEARNNAALHAKDMGETVSRLTSARALHETQAGLAEQNGAQEKDKPGQQSDIARALRAQNEALKGRGGDGDGFPELAEPLLVLASPAGIASTTAQSTHIASDHHTSLSTGKSVSIAAGESFFASVKQTLRLFAHKAGMKLIAAAGDIDLKALSDNINLLAKLNITHTGNKIIINATEAVEINGGGSYVKFSAAGIEHGSKGGFVVHSANQFFKPEQSIDAKHQADFVDGTVKKYSQQVMVDPALWNVAGAAQAVSYKFISNVNTVLGSGTLDGEGKSSRLFTDMAQPAAVEIDVNGGQWKQMMTDRHDELGAPLSGVEVVFDYLDHDEVDDLSDLPDEDGQPDGQPV